MKKILFLFLIFTSTITAQRTTIGHVIRVIDGDTYVVDASYKGNPSTLRIRLVNVDCPEIYFIPKKRPAQPWGDMAKDLVSQLILDRDIEITYYGKDQYNRVLAFIKIDGIRLDDLVLKNGWGWAYKKYHVKKDYKRGLELQEKAKRFKTGLWIDTDPIEPAEWRKKSFN